MERRLKETRPGLYTHLRSYLEDLVGYQIPIPEMVMGGDGHTVLDTGVFQSRFQVHYLFIAIFRVIG